MTEGRQYFVYRLYDDDGDLLYVGCTNRLKERWGEHRLQRPQMATRVAKCRVQGPYTRPVGHRIERAALESEHPLYGWTPQKQSAIQIQNNWKKQRTHELVGSGQDISAASELAVAEARAVFPSSPTYYEPWRPEVSA